MLASPGVAFKQTEVYKECSRQNDNRTVMIKPLPNILVFMTDHQRADTLLPWARSHSPHLDQMAHDGITFTQAYCPSPHCCPSRASFFTGLYPSGHGVWNNVCNDQALSRGLKPGVRLWSEDLAQVGYELHFCGKWHVSVEEGPADRGWIEDAVTAYKGVFHGRSWEEYRQMAETPEPSHREEGVILRPGYGPCRMYGEVQQPHPSDTQLVETSLEIIDQLSASHGPWGLYTGIVAPHDPYLVEGKYLDRYPLDEITLPPSYTDRAQDKPAVYRRMREMLFDQLTEREVRNAIRHYLAMCSAIDDQFGSLLDRLEKTGQANHTLVLFVSDHGDYLGDHGLFAKGIPCFQGAYHIPAVMRWPAGIQHPGRTEPAFVSLADFGPTFLEAAGVKPDRHFSGESLLPFLRDEKPSGWRDEVHTQCNGVELYYTQRSVMTREWKYVFNGFDQDELYHLREDPHEMHNLADDLQYRDQKRDLCRRLWRFAHREGDTAINPYITVGLAPYGPAEAFRA
jgi:arylsulfatase A-like enzyme